MAAGDVVAKSRRLFVQDRDTALRLLVDTGADVSVVPATAGDRKFRSNYSLFAANNSRIATYGERILCLNLNLRREFKWPFLIADVSCAIIGADFLSHFSLLPDLRNGMLRDGVTELRTRGTVVRTAIGSVTTFEKGSNFAGILAEFPGITKTTAGKRRIAKHRTEHVIETKGPPVTARARRLPPGKLAAAKLAFQAMLEAGEARPSTSPWASPLHVVPKPDGTWRMCGDYRALNARTTPDRYPVPNIQDFNAAFAGTVVFTKLDIVRAYYQIPVAEADIEKTAVITPFGLFEFPAMPFGLRNAAQTFQRYIDSLLREFDYAYAYIDDILIASRDRESHEAQVRAVLQRLDEAGLTVNSAKCCYAQEEVTFLGYRVTRNGISPCPERVKPILEFPRPANVEELRRFLGMVNFYRRCLRNAAVVQARLFALITTNKKKDQTPLIWTKESEAAFNELKSTLANAALLAHPDENLPIVLSTDASDTAMGAVLQQVRGGECEPLAFFSRKLSPTQINYSAYDRELLAIYEAIRHFSELLEGRDFAVYTDHRPLTYAFHRKSNDANPRQRRHLELIGQFTTDIRYVKGVENVPADALSRISVISVPATVPYHDIARSQQGDRELQQLLKSSNTSLKMEALKIQETDLLVFCDTSTGAPRPFIPEQYRRTVFNSVHNLSHPGVKATVRLVNSRFVWPDINRDCAQWARTCLACQRSKVGRHTKSPLGSFPHSSRFSHVHMDIVGPLVPSRGKRYCVTIIDRASRWPEAIPTNDISAEAISEIFLREWVSRFGVPARLTTDQGRQFESQLVRTLTRTLGTDKARTTAYHPQANGKIERWHRCLKASIMANETERWVDILPTVLLGLRSAVSGDTGVSPTQLTFGTELRLPGDFFNEGAEMEIKNAPEYVKQLREAIRGCTRKYRKHGESPVYMPPNLSTSSHVFLQADLQRRSLVPPYTGPYKVISMTENTCTIDMAGKKTVVAMNRVKPAWIMTDPAIIEKDSVTAAPVPPPVTTPRKRGRPRKVRFEQN